MEKHIEILVDRTEYITKEEAYKAINEQYHEIGLDGYQDGIELMNRIAKIPATNMVEVVRCGQCKYCVEHYDTDGNVPYWACKEWDSGTDYDGYCHYGKRKDREQEDG